MKKFKVVFSVEALNDAKEARKWYNQQQKDLGKKLTRDIKDTIISIERNPFFSSVKYNNIRTAACKTFPYALHYEIDEVKSIVTIVSIFHFSRKPLWEDDD
jgi:mRNA-degrading endonuclease RelE of RelBE toxin-antitoxin system